MAGYGANDALEVVLVEDYGVARHVVARVQEDRHALPKGRAKQKEVPEVEEDVGVEVDEVPNVPGAHHFDAVEAPVQPVDQVAHLIRSADVQVEPAPELERLQKEVGQGNLQGEVLKERGEYCTHDHVHDKNEDVEGHPRERHITKYVVHPLGNSKLLQGVRHDGDDGGGSLE